MVVPFSSPMLPSALFAIFVVCLGALACYAAAMLAVGALAWRRPRVAHGARAPEGPAPGVTVLVPSHHEGDALVDTIRALLAQDHPGDLAVWVLVADRDDASIAALARAWPEPWERDAGDPRRRRVVRSPGREVALVACGVAPKRDKLNAVLGDVTTPLVAFLDADHRAAPDWLSSALARMREERARVVQSRRRPLSALRLAQIWDTAQNHVGNEALNRALSSAGHAVFFTGTTAVFDAPLFGGRRFGRSITEDTYLSLELLRDGEHIAYDGESGSYEEVAPSLASFVARRRRWAAGHTHAFFAHARAFVRRRPAHAARPLLLLHGCFYLVPVLVLASLWAQAAHLLVQFPASLLAVWALASAFFAAVTVTVTGTRGLRARGAAVALAWCAPQAAFAAVLLYRWSGAEGYYYLIDFPHQPALRWPVVALLAAPLASLLVAAPAVGGLGVARGALLVVTYPLMLFVDLYAGLLGVADLALGGAVWTKIARENVVAADAVPEAMRRAMTTATVKRARFGALLLVPAAAALVVVTNDLLSPSECGEIRPLLFQPLLFRRRHEIDLALAVTKRRTDADHLEAALEATVRSPSRAALALTWLVDGARFEDGAALRGDARRARTLTFPLGWERHTVGVELRGDAVMCRRSRALSTDVKEIEGRDLLVNGEPFLVKGIIPSFSTRQVHLDYAAGLAQIKATGANAIRVYHEPGAEVLDAAAGAELLVMAQPDRSTWENVDLGSASDRARLVARYRALVADTEGFPYVLMDSVGNELELGGDLERSMREVRETLDAARGPGGAARRFPLSYSTYFTFVDYPVDVVGVNMLDTGPTYWNKAIAMIRGLGKPFLATELGGFTAFRERPSAALRATRLCEQWRRLERAGALGAFFFESHDNWAQAVPPGETNDPLSADQPDDVRGFWDEKNRPKPELATLERLFADVSVRAVARALPPDATRAEVVLANVRRYALRGVRARLPDGTALDVGDLEPKEERTVTLPLGATDDVELALTYTTHHGLSARSRVVFRAPRPLARPVVLDDDFAVTEETPTALRGRLVESRTLDVMLPRDWPTAMVNGARVERPEDGRVSVATGGAYREVLDLEVSRDGRAWSPWRPHITGGGRWHVRFRLPAAPFESLVLRGVGAESVRLTARGRARDLAVHSYRDEVLDPARLGVAPGDAIELEIERDKTQYVSERFSPSGDAVLVDLDAPVVFAPLAVEISRP